MHERPRFPALRLRPRSIAAALLLGLGACAPSETNSGPGGTAGIAGHTDAPGAGGAAGPGGAAGSIATAGRGGSAGATGGAAGDGVSSGTGGATDAGASDGGRGGVAGQAAAPVADSRRLVDRLVAAGADASMHEVPDAGHGFQTPATAWPDAEKAMFDWLVAHGIGK